MDSAIHAQLMAHNCSPAFAELVLQVPTRFPADQNLQHSLIGTLVHLSQMASIAQQTEPATMTYAVADRLLTTATVESVSFQQDAARFIVSAVVHANSMTRITPEAADGIYATIRPFANESLPTGSGELKHLQDRLAEARSTISSLVHSAQMARLLRHT